MARCAAIPATRHSAHQPGANRPSCPATAPPRATGTIVAVRNGNRVARKTVQNADKRGRTPTLSMYARPFGTLFSAYSKKGVSTSSQPVARVGVTVTTPRSTLAVPQTLTYRRSS